MFEATHYLVCNPSWKMHCMLDLLLKIRSIKKYCPEGLWTFHHQWIYPKLKWTRLWATITPDLSLVLLRIAVGTLIGVNRIVLVWKHRSNSGRRIVGMGEWLLMALGLADH